MKSLKAPKSPKSPPKAQSHPPAPASTDGWTFLSKHAHVLICLALQPDSRLRDVAARVGITERAVQKIVAELTAAGVLSVNKSGRRNHYTLHTRQPLRHPVESHRTIHDLIKMVTG